MKVANMVPCDTCGLVFNKPKCHVERTKNNYCGKRCADIGWEKRILKNCIFCNTQFEIRISESKKYVTCNTEICRQKKRLGPRNGNWKGGISPLNANIRRCNKYREWVKKILIRDDYTCKLCSRRGYNLEVDHIKPFALIMKENKITTFEEAMRCKELWLLNNGRTLCKACHKTTFIRKKVMNYGKTS